MLCSTTSHRPDIPLHDAEASRIFVFPTSSCNMTKTVVYFETILLQTAVSRTAWPSPATLQASGRRKEARRFCGRRRVDDSCGLPLQLKMSAKPSSCTTNLSDSSFLGSTAVILYSAKIPTGFCRPTPGFRVRKHRNP